MKQTQVYAVIVSPPRSPAHPSASGPIMLLVLVLCGVIRPPAPIMEHEDEPFASFATCDPIGDPATELAALPTCSLPSSPPPAAAVPCDKRGLPFIIGVPPTPSPRSANPDALERVVTGCAPEVALTSTFLTDDFGLFSTIGLPQVAILLVLLLRLLTPPLRMSEVELGSGRTLLQSSSTRGWCTLSTNGLMPAKRKTRGEKSLNRSLRRASTASLLEE